MEQHFRTLKCPLKGVVKEDYTLESIQSIVEKINKLRCHMLQFGKLYCIHLYDQNRSLPEINRGFYQCIVRLLTVSEKKRKSFKTNEGLFTDLETFYNDHYNGLMYNLEEDLNVSGLRTVINYMIIDVITDHENNIKIRHYSHTKNFVECSFQKKEYFNMIKKLEKNPQRRRKLLNMKLKTIKNSLSKLYNIEDTETLTLYGEWIDEQKKIIFPCRKLKKDSIPYDIQCSPQDYFFGMIFMNRFCENHEYKFLNMFTLKRSIVPGHIRLDTESLIDVLVTENKKQYKEKGGVKLFKDHIWSLFFRTEKEIFNSKGFSFNGSVQTDGISVSILQKNKKLLEVKKISKLKENKELYIDDIKGEELVSLQKKKFVSIDPNKSDLVYCSSGSYGNDEYKTFRYTQNQRNSETHKKKHKRILEIEKLQSDTPVSEIETELSAFNSKTTYFAGFKEYVLKKNEINYKLNEFYNRPLWRKQRLSSFTRTLKSEQKLINNFKRKFGNPEKTFIGFGDWCQKQHMKFQQPTKGKGFRTLFRKAGYNVLLVDEFRSSKQCSKCQNKDGICETFKSIQNPRPWKANEVILCHGLVKCKTCNTLFNRDANATSNITNIIQSHLSGFQRPEYLRR